MKKVRALVPVVVAAAAVMLSGCDIHPGTAAQVGDESISMSTVDTTAADYCAAIERQLNGDHQVVPQSFFRRGIAATLALRSAAEQLAREYGVEPGKVYDKKVADLEQQMSILPDKQQTAVVLVSTGSDYVSAIQEAVGRKILQAQGTADPAYSDALSAGQNRFDQWISDHGIEFDPALEVSVADGKVQHADTSLSYAVGTSARSGASDSPDQAYAAGLPDAHRCGG